MNTSRYHRERITSFKMTMMTYNVCSDIVDAVDEILKISFRYGTMMRMKNSRGYPGKGKKRQL